MRYLLPVLLLSSQILFTNNYTKTTICYDQATGHSEIWSDPANGKFSAVSYEGVSEILNPISIGEAIQLPHNFQYFASTKESDMFGLTPEIKYNYQADLDTSSKVLNTYLLEGWEIIRYEADVYAIYVELSKGKDKVRIIIFEDSIKIYDKRL